MKRLLMALSILFAASSSFAVPEVARVISISAIESGDPASLLSEGQVKLPGEASFVKLILEFARDEKIAFVRLNSCADKFVDGATFYFDPNQRFARGEGGREFLEVAVPNGEPVQSIAIVMGHNTGACLKSLQIFDAKHQALPLSTGPSTTAEKNSNRARLFTRKSFADGFVMPAFESDLVAVKSDDAWVFRLRGDRSFYIHGFDDDIKNSRSFSAFGHYAVKHVTDGTVRLHLEGIRVRSVGLWDGAPLSSSVSSPVNEDVVIEKWKGADFMIRNRTDIKNRTLPFGDLEVKVTSLEE